eukprot:jgi/Galph1/1145/GphlegSOOS_G5846.1
MNSELSLALKKRGYHEALGSETIVEKIQHICSHYNITYEKLLLQHDLMVLNNEVKDDQLSLSSLEKLETLLLDGRKKQMEKENNCSETKQYRSTNVVLQPSLSLDSLFTSQVKNQQTYPKVPAELESAKFEECILKELGSPPFSPAREPFKASTVTTIDNENNITVIGDDDPDELFLERKNSGEILDEYIGTDYKDFKRRHRQEDSNVSLIINKGGKPQYISKNFEYCMELFEQNVYEVCRSILSTVQNVDKEHVLWPTTWDLLPTVGEEILVAGYVIAVEKKPDAVYVGVNDTQSRVFKVAISSVKSCCIFRGQAVVFQGSRRQENFLEATRLYTSSIKNNVAFPEQANARHLMMLDPSPAIGTGLSIMIVSGPYTTSTNLKYNPLKEFLARVEKERPDLVILQGPFLDEKHRFVESGMITTGYRSILAMRIGAELKRCFEQSSGKCVIIPHIQDVFHNFTVPQHEYQEDLFFPNGTPRNIYFLKNPMSFRFGDISIAATSIPILDDMSSVAYVRAPPERGRIPALCETLLDQKCFYPIFPPVNRRPLDYGNINELYFDSEETQLFILTSSLKPFVRVLKGGTVCINPGHLSKGVNSGTFGHMRICLNNNITDGCTQIEDFPRRIHVRVVRN